MRLIDADKMIQRVRDHNEEEYEIIRSWIDGQPTIHQTTWIKCDELLPSAPGSADECGEYLVYDQNGKVSVANITYSDGTWWTVPSSNPISPVAWMPIPAPVKDRMSFMSMIGKPAMLEQLAEECTELAKAALKEARILRGENPTPVRLTDAAGAVSEEYTDVVQCATELDLIVDYTQMDAKYDRWKKRLEEDDNFRQV